MLFDDEVKIIHEFMNELNMYGHNGYCSFGEKLDNGYYINKEDNCWNKEFYKKGERVKLEKYTNIYNLCLDILDEMKIESYSFKNNGWKVPRGTRVIISSTKDCPGDEIKEGVIMGISTEVKEKGKRENIYQVIDGSQRLYTGVYGFNIEHEVFFRTMEDYLSDTEKEIGENAETITSLKELNWDLELNIDDVKLRKDQYLGIEEKTK